MIVREGLGVKPPCPIEQNYKTQKVWHKLSQNARFCDILHPGANVSDTRMLIVRFSIQVSSEEVAAGTYPEENAGLSSFRSVTEIYQAVETRSDAERRKGLGNCEIIRLLKSK